ncbi:MAG: hypothetical protein ACR2LM_05805 [Pyrinomonadaceae bacterium]
MQRTLSENSLYIEKTLEHLLLAKLSQVIWRRKSLKLLEIATAEIDNKGFDVVLTLGDITRHVQLKCLKLGGKRAHIDVNVGLALKPSGCVLLCEYDPKTLEFERFRFFGNDPGQRLSSIKNLPVALNPRRNKQGRTLRKNVRKIPKSCFIPVDTIEGVAKKLFG